jgi:hypothetical protein
MTWLEAHRPRRVGCADHIVGRRCLNTPALARRGEPAGDSEAIARQSLLRRHDRKEP